MSQPIVQITNGNIFHGKTLILSDLNFDIQPGEFVYLIGKSGSGKSSFLKTLYSDQEIQAQQAECCGYNLLNIKRKEIPFLRRKIGIVFQEFELLNDRTVFENLAFVLQATGWKAESAMKSRIETSLESVGLHDKGDKKPHQLSGGERQRVAIARALLNTPSLIIADEPTGNLDPQMSMEITELLYQISQSGTAVLMASHDYIAMQKFVGDVWVCQGQSIKRAEPR
ncbi:MAG: hypothetical protein RL062_1213 [Bacteroidota bacterium]|jgi:cell division transport system ATP-binding protein